jgi:uroporphyrinogen-III synthase
MSLKDKRIVVTRAAHQAGKLVKMLQDKEAVPLLYPCIDIATPDDTSELDAALEKLDTFSWLILTSSNTVLALHRRIEFLRLKINWEQIKIAVVGSSTATAVEGYFDVKPDFVPDVQTGKALAENLPYHEAMSVFLPQSNIAGTETADILRQREIEVTLVSAYENIVGHGGEDIPAQLRQNRVDALTFTSSSTVVGFVQRIEPLTAYDVPAACIGTSTAELAESYSFKNIIVPEHFALEDMLTQLENYYTKTSSHK